MYYHLTPVTLHVTQYNKQALEAIKKSLRGKSQAQRLGILCFDELSFKENITFNTSSFQFERFVNLGSSIEEATQKLANHGLVFMFRPLLDSLVQPIAEFKRIAAQRNLLTRNLRSLFFTSGV